MTGSRDTLPVCTCSGRHWDKDCPRHAYKSTRTGGSGGNIDTGNLGAWLLVAACGAGLYVMINDSAIRLPDINLPGPNLPPAPPPVFDSFAFAAHRDSGRVYMVAGASNREEHALNACKDAEAVDSGCFQWGTPVPVTVAGGQCWAASVIPSSEISGTFEILARFDSTENGAREKVSALCDKRRCTYVISSGCAPR